MDSEDHLFRNICEYYGARAFFIFSSLSTSCFSVARYFGLLFAVVVSDGDVFVW